MIAIIDLIIISGLLVVVGSGIYSARIKYRMSQEGQAKRLKKHRQTYRVSKSRRVL